MFRFGLIWIWWVEKWIAKEAFWIEIQKNEFDSKTSCDLHVLQFGEFVHLDVACSWYRSKPRNLEPCRRLLQRRNPPFPRDRATGTATARGPTAPSIEETTRVASKQYERGRHKQSQCFFPSLPPKPHEHRPYHEFAQKFDRCIPVAFSPAWGVSGLRQPPKTSQERR